jgi:rfaE bifunctional protein nucleotidyltransferase chain/domain/rfaE bifunctional protein kinase chain/domain
VTARRLVVVGDSLLDRDIDGSVTRIAPDAPAPVLDEASTTDRPGGAGLAALFAAGRGFDVVLITALADDAGGARLAELLAAAGVTVYGLPCAGATAEKVRLRAGGRVLLRLDRGGRDGEVPGDPTDAALAELADAAAVLVSDYGRGVARQPALRAALAGTSAPVVWDPHPRGPAAVPGVRLATPNEGELRGLTGVAADRRLASAARGAAELRRRWRAGAVAVTLGADGALLSHAAPTPLVVPVPARADGDTCGAGDRFAAAATVALAGGALVPEAVRAAVAEAATYVASGGPATVPALLRAASTPARADVASAAASGAASSVAPGGVASSVAPGGAASSVAPGGVASSVAPGGAVNGNGASANGARANGSRGRVAVLGQPAAPAARVGAEAVGAVAVGAVAARVRAGGGTVVATGGCFDLLHAGHLATLEAARSLGDCLIVCLNSDASVRALKGPERPLTGQADRARLLGALGCVDAVVIFDETTPHAVLSWLRPDVWVKGGDYAGGVENPRDLPEAELVTQWGGQTVVVPYLDGRSTTGMIAAARGGAGGTKGAELR